MGLLLAASAAYLFAIDKFSPHHLPGLRWIGGLVAIAGAVAIVRSTRFRRVELGACLLVVICGLFAVDEILIGARQPAAHPAAKVTASN